MTVISEERIGDIVTRNYRAADVFKKFQIDFCCGGGKSIAEICKQKALDPAVIIDELTKLESVGKNDETDNYAEMDVDGLIDHIVASHHEYVRQSIPVILQYADKVARVHGEANPETIRISEIFHMLSDELLTHMHKEEQILFPFIRKIFDASESSAAGAFSVSQPIQVMEHDHDAAGNFLKQMRALSDNYDPPSHACNTYRVLFAKLEEFETDLHKHVHLENNILFPRAISQENKLK